VDSLALADAAEACDFLQSGETVALVNIGLGSASIHFVKDGKSNFIRDVSWGARELLSAIAKDRRVDLDEADRILRDAANGVEEKAPDVKPAEPARAEDIPSAQPAGGNPFNDPFGENVVPAATPASLLDPLDEEPTAHSRPSALAGRGSAKPLRETLAVPLARLVSEIRRSFDYYEHQLYERPVDRVMLSGGIAHLPLLTSVISEELGVDSVQVANPAASALKMGDDFAIAELQQRPAQFMVAIGLAARGMADL